MAEILNPPKLTKESLITRSVAQFGGRKSYYRKLSKEQLEVLLSANLLVQQSVIQIISQLGESAQTNQKVNGRRLVAENKAENFEGQYKGELQRRVYIEQQYYKVLDKLKQLLDVKESEILKASRIALQLLKQMTKS